MKDAQSILLGGLLALLFLIPNHLRAQEVIWDRQLVVGDLIAFPSVYEPSEYYYAATKARIAREKRLPKFSFLRFSELNQTGGNRSLGGGVIHALIELGVSEAELEEAREALAELAPGGKLVGPVAYSSGNFSLVTSVKDENAGTAQKIIIGMGKAPLLEGNRAAVSMQLTQRNANILWSTFNTRTPDISFSFLMSVDAYRSPVKATIEADWAKIYNHESFSAALQAGVNAESAQVMLGAEIDTAFDDLAKSGAIKIKYIGDDEGLRNATDATYAELRKIMFSPANMSGQHNFTPEYQQSAFDKASKAFREAEGNRKARNKQSIADRDSARKAKVAAEGQSAFQAALEKDVARLEKELHAAKKIADDAAREVEKLKNELTSSELPKNKQNELVLKVTKKAESKEAIAKQIEGQLANARSSLATSKSEAAKNQATAEMTTDERDWTQGTQLTAAAHVAYRMKTVKQSGKFTQDLSKYNQGDFELRFDENIGDFTRYLEDESIFTETALDQMVFSQREIQVITNELDRDYFEHALSSIVVTLRKEHQNGKVSIDETVITSDDLEETVVLRYVSNGDRDADLFKTYTYQIDWNYRGGHSISQTCQQLGTCDRNVIGLTPPLTLETVSIDLDPTAVDYLGIVGVTIRPTSSALGKKFRSDTLTLLPDQDAGYSTSTQLIVDPENPTATYQVSFSLDNGQEKRLKPFDMSGTRVLITAEGGAS